MLLAGGFLVDGPGDDRLSRLSTIMGLAGLTAVFGMGTGGTPPVSSPEIGPPEDQSGRPRWIASDSTAGLTRVVVVALESSGRGPRRVGDRYGSG